MKKLTLSKETVRTLDEGQLNQVAGGDKTVTCITCSLCLLTWSCFCPKKIPND